MGHLHNALLTAVGCWILVYRPFLRTRCRYVAEVLTTVSCGISLALISPLLPWPPAGFRVLALGMAGVLLSTCHPLLTAVVVSATLGLGFGSFAWQLGGCRLGDEIGVLNWHAVLLTVLCLAFIVLFVCMPGIAGPPVLRVVLLPLLAGLLLCAGIPGLVSSVGGLPPHRLFAKEPCGAEEGHYSATLTSLAIWAAVAVCGIALQLFLNWRQGNESEKAGGRGDLVTSLLPGASESAEGEPNLPRPSDSANDRYGLICKAIFADEGADLSHLTENEQKLVEVCRKDEFERDRILWGGGLI